MRPGARQLREMVGLLRPDRRLFATALMASVAGPLAAMGLPFATRLVIDDVIGHGRAELLLPVALGAALAVVLQALAAYGVGQAGAAMGHLAVSRLRQRLHRHTLALPVSYFDATPTGHVVSRCTADAEQMRALFGSGALQIVSGTLTAVFAFAVMTWLDWRLAAVVGAVLSLITFGLTRGIGRLHPAFHTVSERQARLAGRLTEVLGGIRMVKAAGAERREALALTRESNRLLRASLSAHRHVSLLIAAMALAAGGVGLGLLVLGGQAVARGAMTLGDLALFVFLIGTLSSPLMQVVALGGELGRAVAAMTRIMEVLALPTERSTDTVRTPVRTVVGTVAFDGVSYRYGTGPLVLREISFLARAGSITALVGPNGAGKSTVMSLLLGFDRPTTGRVLIDGRPLAALRVADYRRHLGAVLQRDQIIDGTITENIRYARPGATTAEFRSATRLAHCDEFVARLPEGYDTLVGERGVRLSGGQRQRVAIARAFLADPRILLLDEATSQLDSESERLVQEALTVLCRGRTTFVIAHRLTTIQRVDQILVLQSGVVTERGTPKDLEVMHAN